MPIAITSVKVGDTIRIDTKGSLPPRLEKPYSHGGNPRGYYQDGDTAMVIGIDTQSRVAACCGGTVVVIPAGPGFCYAPIDGNQRGIPGSIGLKVSDCAVVPVVPFGVPIWLSSDADQRALAQPAAAVAKDKCTCDFAWPNTLLGCRCGHLAWLRSQEKSKGG